MKQSFFHGEGLLPLAQPLTRGPPLVGCPRLLIQHIRNYPPHLETVPSICNRRMRIAVVTGTHMNMIHCTYSLTHSRHGAGHYLKS
jgi:hypothetical protein